MVDIVALGGDGYIGWALSLELAARHPDKRVTVADNFLTRRNSARLGARSLLPVAGMADRLAAAAEALGIRNLNFRPLCCSDADELAALLAECAPEVVYHLAHQRSAPYSMLGLRESAETIVNNEVGFLNLIWGMKDVCPDAHLIKLGSFGAYAKAGLDIPEGNAIVTINGSTSAAPMPFPRASDDFYHITKINDGNFAGLACRKWGLRITDVMQSTVFGAGTDKTTADERLHTRFDYDEILGTVVNRFVTQAIAGQPLTVYGDGEQTSGIMALEDCVAVLAALADDPGPAGVHRIVNNSPASYSINDLAGIVRSEASRFGLDATVLRNHYNPRFEGGPSFPYSVETGYIDRTITPTPLSECVARSIALLLPYRSEIDIASITPTHSWFGREPAPALQPELRRSA